MLLAWALGPLYRLQLSSHGLGRLAGISFNIALRSGYYGNCDESSIVINASKSLFKQSLALARAKHSLATLAVVSIGCLSCVRAIATYDFEAAMS